MLRVESNLDRRTFPVDDDYRTRFSRLCATLRLRRSMVDVSVIVGGLRVQSDFNIPEALYRDLGRVDSRMAITEPPALSVSWTERRALSSRSQAAYDGHPNLEAVASLLRSCLYLLI